jgi:DNA polymerase phi
VRDHLLGHLFGLGALVRGGLVREAGAARAVITHLLALTAKKAWLREAVVSVLLDLLLGGGAPSAQEGEGAGGVPSRWLSDAAVRDLLSTGPAGCPELRSFLSLGPKEASPEALLLALHLWPLMPADLLAASPLPHSASTPPPPVGFPQRPATTAAHRAAVARAASALFRHDYLAHILPALQETTCASPRLHSLWPTLLAFLLPGFTLQKSKV